MAKVQKGDDAAISKINKLGKSMNKLSKAAKFTGWGILTEVGFAAPFAAINYAKGANRDEIISEATFGLFGKSKDEQLREKYNDYGQVADFKKTYDDLLTAENLSKTGGGYRTQAYNKLKAKDLENKFVGKNFVFDHRRSERISDDVIANCHQCGEACDEHVNCENQACHLLFIQCPSCQAKMDTCCSTECKEIASLSYEEQKELRRGKETSNKIFKKGRSEVLKYKK